MITTNHTPSLTVFFPAYNDADVIEGLVVSALNTVAHLTGDYEVLVVDDGSTDETATVLKVLARKQPQLRVIRHSQNLGYGAALRPDLRMQVRNWFSIPMAMANTTQAS